MEVFENPHGFKDIGVHDHDIQKNAMMFCEVHCSELRTMVVYKNTVGIFYILIQYTYSYLLLLTSFLLYLYFYRKQSVKLEHQTQIHPQTEILIIIVYYLS